MTIGGRRRHGAMTYRRASLLLASLAMLAPFAGCASVAPQTADLPLAPVPLNDRDWQPNLAQVAFAKIEGDKATIHNVRQTVYLSADEYIVRYRDQTVDLNDVSTVDILICPFAGAPSLAHTMLSFGFDNGKHLILSVEARLEKGESYSPLSGALDRYELIYILADEKDPVLLRTKYRGDPVFLYPTNLNRAECRRAFESALAKANELREKPEFYSTLTNNCTTGMMQHVEAARPTGVLYDPRLVLTGLTDRVAYDFGLIDGQVSYELTRRRSDITELANKNADRDDFSQRIRVRIARSQRVPAVAAVPTPGNR